MAWEIEFTDQFEDWWHGLSYEQQVALTARIDLLEEHGPSLGRPTVDRIAGSNYPNMKELRATKAGDLRVLFIFDPLSRAILLLGGDKSGQWSKWYVENIPIAEKLYEEHLQELHQEGQL